MLGWGIKLVELGLVPDFIIRKFIRLLCAKRLKQPTLNLTEYISFLKTQPIADFTDSANEQHYELPSEFFELCLGNRKKYSCCDWDNDIKNLNQAELRSLEVICQRAQIKDGMHILELGCGWGALTLWLAENFPLSKITAVSNSKVQRKYIEKQMQSRNIKNVQIITNDMNHFDTNQRFDRILSIEMFEHMKNYEKLFLKISNWLAPDGILFIHIFIHKTKHYLFETKGDDNWLGKYFFTGGQMPSFELLENMSGPLQLDQKWYINGLNYFKTSEAWLKLLDINKKEVFTILKSHYSPKESKLWYNRWRVFFMSVSELFGYQQGMQWGVGHYVFRFKR